MEEQQIGLGLTPLALQAVLQHLTPQTKTSLLRCSRAVRHEVLMSAEALSFAPRSSSRSQLRHRSKQLCDVLRQRTEPFHLTLDLRQGPKGAELAALLSEVAGTSRPVRNGSPTCCVEKLVIWVSNSTVLLPTIGASVTCCCMVVACMHRRMQVTHASETYQRQPDGRCCSPLNWHYPHIAVYGSFLLLLHIACRV